MKKVGILTHYYHSMNYGGNLQAYALAYYINSLAGYNAEQICYTLAGKRKSDKEKFYIRLKQRIRDFVNNPVFSLKMSIYDLCQRGLDEKYKVRTNALYSFNEYSIPHSRNVYEDKDLNKLNEEYDVFVTGSDQVWSGCSEGFSLGFAVRGKIKVSYAASIARKEISDQHALFLKDRITDYAGISVRDTTDKKIVEKLTDKPVEVVVDPVFLLEEHDWERMMPNRRYCKKKYVFCYMLGNNIAAKSVIREYAREHRLEVINIAHFVDNENQFIKTDCFFGKSIYDVSPADFVALINNAEFVFTDSFHATAFALLLNKDFCVFDRVSKWGDMSSRLVNLLRQYNCIDRFCKGDNLNLKYVNDMQPVDYEEVNCKLARARHDSREFLLSALRGEKII